MIKKFLRSLRPLVDRFPLLASLYRAIRDQLDSKDALLRTPWGFMLAGNQLMSSGKFEPTETAKVRELLADVDVLVNVGANIGYYCCHALSLGKSVLAFEPIQRNLQYLYRNVLANGWDAIEIFPVALSDKPGIMDMFGGDTGASLIKGWAGCPDIYSTLVSTMRFDTIVGERLKGKKSLVVIDVEGAEKMVLDGANSFIRQTPAPIWIIEIACRECQPKGVEVNPVFADTFSILFRNGYQVFNIGTTLRPISQQDIQQINAGVMTTESNNYLFCKV